MLHVPRRPLAWRQRPWLLGLARQLSAWCLEPNQMSWIGLGLAALGGGFLLCGEFGSGWLLLAALMVALRALAHTLDGLMAIEGQQQVPSGPFVNELADRLADTALFIPLGYAIGVPEWGWALALLTMLTAYVRLLGGSLGLTQDFGGPLAKVQRLMVLGGGCLFGAVEGLWSATRISLWLTALVLTLGSLTTLVRRSLGVLKGLRSPQKAGSDRSTQ